MAGDPPLGYGATPTVLPPAETWPPSHLGQPASRPPPRLAIAVVATAAVAVVALFVALTRPTYSHSSMATTTDAQCQAALDDAIAKDAGMKKVCGVG